MEQEDVEGRNVRRNRCKARKRYVCQRQKEGRRKEEEDVEEGKFKTGSMEGK